MPRCPGSITAPRDTQSSLSRKSARRRAKGRIGIAAQISQCRAHSSSPLSARACRAAASPHAASPAMKLSKVAAASIAGGYAKTQKCFETSTGVGCKRGSRVFGEDGAIGAVRLREGYGTAESSQVTGSADRRGRATERRAEKWDVGEKGSPGARGSTENYAGSRNVSKYQLCTRANRRRCEGRLACGVQLLYCFPALLFSS